LLKKRRLLGFSCLFLIRALAAVLCESYFVPDEHWQSLEIAHHMVFGYGFLTWEWHKGIRSFLFPAPFALLYKLLQWFRLDTPATLMFLPRILMCVQLAFQDLLVFDIGGDRALAVYLSLWGSSYFGTRTLTNSLESLFFLLLYRFESPVVLVVVAFWLRPTSLFASIWFFDFRRSITLRNLGIGVLSVMGLVVFDAVCYAKESLPVPWFTPLRFLYFNFVKGYAVKYGSQPLFFYFYSCVPSLLVVLTPFLYRCLGSRFFRFAIADIFLLSLSRHKEIRYLAPVLPFFALALAPVVQNWTLHLNAIVQLTALIFLSRFHQIGQTRIMEYVSRDPLPTMFLLPCHSTPLTPSVHRNITLTILPCPPDGFSASAAFLADPRGFVGNLSTYPSFQRIVTYQGFEAQISDWLADQFMTRKVSLFNSLFFVDGIDNGRVVLYNRIAK
jgi:phosphatidylinositol glycan class B